MAISKNSFRRTEDERRAISHSEPEAPALGVSPKPSVVFDGLFKKEFVARRREFVA
jgi:hypothetical protein